MRKRVAYAALPGIALAFVNLFWRLPNGYVWFGAGIGLLLVCTTYGVQSFVRYGKIIRQAKGMHGRVCTNCLYPIPESAAGVWQCPECGDRRAVEESELMWKNAAF